MVLQRKSDDLNELPIGKVRVHIGLDAGDARDAAAAGDAQRDHARNLEASPSRVKELDHLSRNADEVLVECFDGEEAAGVGLRQDFDDVHRQARPPQIAGPVDALLSLGQSMHVPAVAARPPEHEERLA